MSVNFSNFYVEHSSKHRDYFPIYDEIINNNTIDRFGEYKILEIGIDTGHGLRALKNYFPNSIIYGLDILQQCKIHEEENINVIIGSQVDDNILNMLSNINFDLIIDDGSHKNDHVFYTFNALFKSLNPNKIGLYIVEDTHTSYWPYYNGGYKNPNSSVELFKNLIDYQHAWCIRDPISCHTPPYNGAIVPSTYFEKWIKYTQFYENIIVIKKRIAEARCAKPI
jgi:hypothetical protein